MMKTKNQGPSSSSSSSKRIVAVVDASLSLSWSGPSSVANNHKSRTPPPPPCCHVEVHDRPDPSLGIAVNQATVQQCRSYLYVQEDGAKEDMKEEKPLSSGSSLLFSFCEIQAIPTDFGAFLLRPKPSSSSSTSPCTSTTTIATTCPMMVGNGSLYTVTRLDPLFFLLTADRLPLSSSSSSETNSSSSSSSSQWQPLEQILDALQDPALVSCLQSNPQQLKHLFDQLNLGGGNDDDSSEYFYKFSVAKALVWLTRKQVVVQQVLLQQQLKQQAELKTKSQSLQGVNATHGGGGSFCSTFNLIPDDKDLALLRNKQETTTISVEQQAAAAALRVQQEQERQRLRLETRARDESIQIICTYLDDASWKGAFLQHLQVSDAEMDQVLWGKTSHSATSIGNNSHTSNKRPASTTAATTGASFATASTSSTTQKSNGSNASSGNNGAGHASKKPRQTAKSAGVKRLEKAAAGKNKGMQKMTSFFQAVPKKKMEHNENDKN